MQTGVEAILSSRFLRLLSEAWGWSPSFLLSWFRIIACCNHCRCDDGHDDHVVVAAVAAAGVYGNECSGLPSYTDDGHTMDTTGMLTEAAGGGDIPEKC